MIGKGGKGKGGEKNMDIHSSLHLPLVQTNHTRLINASRVERMQARLITFKPHILRFNEICFSGFRSVSAALEDT